MHVNQGAFRTPGSALPRAVSDLAADERVCHSTRQPAACVHVDGRRARRVKLPVQRHTYVVAAVR